MYRGTGVSRGVRRTTWERSLKNWELQTPCLEDFFWGGNTLGLVPSSHPHSVGYACTLYAPTSPLPMIEEERRCNTRGGEASESFSEENCPLEALRGFFFSGNFREVLLEALGFVRGLDWSFPFVVAPPFPLEMRFLPGTRRGQKKTH